MMLQMLWINSMGHPKFQFTGLVPCGYFTPFSICPKSYAGIWVEYETNEFVNGLFVVDYRRSTETIRPLEKVTLKVGAFSKARVYSSGVPRLDGSDSELTGIVFLSIFCFKRKVPSTHTAGITPCGFGGHAVFTRFFEIFLR